MKAYFLPFEFLAKALASGAPVCRERFICGIQLRDWSAKDRLQKGLAGFSVSLIFVGGGLLAGAFSSLSAQVPLEVQSQDRPMGLDIVGPVNEAGSDDASAIFQANELPVLQDFIDSQLGESQALSDVGAMVLDPEVLRLTTESDIRVYFLGEGAGYHNTLGFSSTNPEGVVSNSLVFPDASSTNSYFVPGDGGSEPTRTESFPLLPGDFVDLGNYEAGTDIDFFLNANGANGGTNVWYTTLGANADGIQHAVSFALKDSPYLLVGFEDLYGGGDKDYNDLVFAVDIGAANVQYLANPEPEVLLVLLVVLPALWWYSRRAEECAPIVA